VRVGVPKEVKNHEYRVAITPVGVHELVEHGHEVFVERGAGLGSPHGSGGGHRGSKR
jgi:alanine dehydrogenase